MPVRSFHRFLPPIAAIAGFGLFCLLYLVDRSDYYDVLSALGIKPFRYPFLDGENLLVSADCWREGINVYVVNPCDIMGRVQNYSPLWLRLDFLAGGRLTTNLLGLTMDIALLLALFWLPRPTRLRDSIQITLAVLSTMTVFALERANVDVVMFVLVVFAAVLLLRSGPARLAGYVAILVAGFLKFYPLVLLTLAVVERPRRFVAIAGVATAAIFCFVWRFLPELREIPSHIPGGLYFNDMFGASNLPYGILIMAGVNPATQHYPALLLMFLLLAGLAYGMVRLSMEDEVQAAVGRLPKAEAMFLAIGATLICGCFVVGQSVAYRGIFFLLALPGILKLAQDQTALRLRTRAAGAGIMILFLMWGDTIRSFLSEELQAAGFPEGTRAVIVLLVWGLREMLWWSVITTLGSLLLCFLKQSDQGFYARLLMRRPRLSRGTCQD